ncbi:hypothetical protein COCC4DRAFT_63930 [Bipolaris maydis ATCC 48331]|uniref:Uncharacterized protein n=2 Tax=Cochliobolus heterostrophus TaxID=5016 RepID=M2SKY0_COCH5|nr:uncharacterized protein COCC4DRAFT_63930 [Bipolaris maydis ATCC 48331]EMD85970.1 hypothetical protein COCHEDRAFT_1160906 [Bipolaris maydis C5]ENI01973.1 hypothetical protein COCC4DRAFT_63930 [Bipolaris maydis ATCC 48331]
MGVSTGQRSHVRLSRLQANLKCSPKQSSSSFVAAIRLHPPTKSRATTHCATASSSRLARNHCPPATFTSTGPASNTSPHPSPH